MKVHKSKSKQMPGATRKGPGVKNIATSGKSKPAPAPAINSRMKAGKMKGPPVEGQ